MDDLWNNPMVENARKALSPENLERYKKLGESMFNGMDFQKSTTAQPPALEDAIFYIEEGLKSGLHPSMLQSEETRIMREFRGDKWFEEWGYVENDLEKIHTLVKH